MGEGGEIGAAAHTTEARREREERRVERDREIDGNKKTELYIYSLFLLPRCFLYLKKNNTPNSGPLYLHGHLLVAVAAQIATPCTVTSRTGKVCACCVQ
mgnify:CR=1 FL=1